MYEKYVRIHILRTSFLVPEYLVGLTVDESKSDKIVHIPSDHKICFILHGNEEFFTVIFFIGIYVLTEKHMTDSF